MLAIVAIATAWSGYQAALWTGHQSELYGQASKLRVQAEGAATFANQERLYNASTVVEWLKAEAHNDKKLTALFERRFLPEFRPAFEAWKKTDPLNNPNAPAGPQLMAEYRSSKTEEAARLNDQATEVFEQGTRGREYADQYVRATVTLATVLLLIAISQRFKTRPCGSDCWWSPLSCCAFPFTTFLRCPEHSRQRGVEEPVDGLLVPPSLAVHSLRGGTVSYAGRVHGPRSIFK